MINYPKSIRLAIIRVSYLGLALSLCVPRGQQQLSSHLPARSQATSAPQAALQLAACPCLGEDVNSMNACLYPVMCWQPPQHNPDRSD